MGGGSGEGRGSAWVSIAVGGGALNCVSIEEVAGGEQSAKETEGTEGGSTSVVSPEMVGWAELNPCWTGCCI